MKLKKLTADVICKMMEKDILIPGHFIVGRAALVIMDNTDNGKAYEYLYTNGYASCGQTIANAGVQVIFIER